MVAVVGVRGVSWRRLPWLVGSLGRQAITSCIVFMNSPWRYLSFDMAWFLYARCYPLVRNAHVEDPIYIQTLCVVNIIACFRMCSLKSDILLHEIIKFIQNCLQFPGSQSIIFRKLQCKLKNSLQLELVHFYCYPSQQDPKVHDKAKKNPIDTFGQT